MKKNITTEVVLDKRRSKKDGTYPLKLRVTFNRKQKYYNINMSFSEEDYQKIISPKPRGRFKDNKLYINAVEEKARITVNDINEFTFQKFEDAFFQKNRDLNCLITALKKRHEELILEGRIKYSVLYQYTIKSLTDFTRKKSINFQKITVKFLKDFEKWAINKGNSLTTVRMYIVNVRTIFNHQIQLGRLKQDYYPFGKGKYELPTVNNIKKALSIGDIEKIYHYQPTPGMEQWALDMWLLSYLCNGINIKDVASLKFSNIQEDKIIFNRSKTLNTKRSNLKPIIAIITPRIKEILAQHKIDSANPNDFVFNILNRKLSEEGKERKIKQAIKNINKYIGRIAQNLGITKKVTTYTARHSFATILKNSGAPVAFISEALGHSSILTTQNYLDSFEDKAKKEFLSGLTNFEKDH